MKALSIFSRSLRVFIALEFLVLICTLSHFFDRDYNKALTAICPIAFMIFFFGAFLLLPSLILIIFFMPWREKWLKLRLQLTIYFFLDLGFILNILMRYGE